MSKKSRKVENCTTQHEACECMESKYQILSAEVIRLREELDQYMQVAYMVVQKNRPDALAMSFHHSKKYADLTCAEFGSNDFNLEVVELYLKRK